MLQIALYVAIGLVIGVISGALGIGGGVLLLPALIWLCGLEPRPAAGTSLAILIPPIGLPAAWRYYEQGHVDLRMVLWIAVAFAGGAYVGAVLVTGHYVPDRVLRLALGLIMVYVGFRYVVNSSSESANAAAGLTAAAFAWLGYYGLRRLGRRHLPPPELPHHIRTMRDQGHGDPEYQI